MAELTERHPTLNLLAREALAATMVLEVSEANHPAWLRLQHVTVGPTVGSRDCPDSALQPTPTLSR